MMGQAALFPLHRPAQFEGPQPLVGRLGQIHEHGVVTLRQPCVPLKLPAQVPDQPGVGVEIATPGALFAIVEPGNIGHDVIVRNS